MTELHELKLRLVEEQQARKAAELLLKERSNDLFASSRSVSEMALFPELSPLPVLRFDNAGALQLANPSAIQLLGAHIVANNNFKSLFPEAKHLIISDIIAQSDVAQLLVRFGSYHFKAIIRGVAEYDFINVYLNDITDLKKVKDKLHEDRTEIEQLIDSISSMLIGLNRKGIVTRFNTVAEMTLGICADDVIGTHIDETPINWSLGTLALISEMLKSQKSITLEEAMYCDADGQEGFIDASITKIISVDNEEVGYLILARDITQRKSLEHQLFQAQKLESLGQLAAGIAHEINTPIQFIGDNTHFLSTAFQRIDKVLETSVQLIKQYGEGEDLGATIQALKEIVRKTKIGYMRSEVPAAIEESIRGLDQVATIVRGMKQFAHPGSGGKKLSDINSCLQNTITVSRNEWKYVADLEMDLEEALPQVLCNANELNQVFLNVIVNAAHAIEKKQIDGKKGKGKITVRTAAKEEAVVIEISDTGSGIPKDILHKIYDPFFTTKEPGKGTGQGLAIAFNVIQKHEGIITVESTEGEGTTFYIRLPAHKYE